MKFRKKPAVVEATQWFKDGDHPAVIRKTDPSRYGDEGVPWVPTLEGGHVVTPGDWIITGVRGEHYPCKPDIFAIIYEPANEAAAPEPEPLAYLVEGWHDDKLMAHIPHLTLEDAKASAAVFSQHYTTTKLVPLYAAPPVALAVPDGSSASSLLTKMERLRHLTPMDVGDTWEDQYAEIVEAIEVLATPLAAPASRPTARPAPAGGGSGFEDMDDDIPF